MSQPKVTIEMDAQDAKLVQAWQEAKHARDNSDRKVFEEKRDYWLKALNDFIVAEMDRGHRLELAERHGYKVTDYT